MTQGTEGRARQFRTAIVPAAGLGTRFLPTTKTVPKELLPVVDTPGIELVAAEAAEAGAQLIQLAFLLTDANLRVGDFDVELGLGVDRFDVVLVHAFSIDVTHRQAELGIR